VSAPQVIGFDESRLDNLRDLLIFSPKLSADHALTRGIAVNLLDQRDKLWNAAQRVLNGREGSLGELADALDWCRPQDTEEGT